MCGTRAPTAKKRVATAMPKLPLAGSRAMIEKVMRGSLKQNDVSSNRHPALAFCRSMILSDLPSPAEASSQATSGAKGFAQAGNRYPLFGIMLYRPAA
jgi:hypothetical protein